MRKVMSIVGARPQFIKSAIVSLKLKEKGITELLLHTGQHYDHNMSDIFFKELGMSEPDWHLDIGSGSHAEQTGRMLEEIEKTLAKMKPELVMVYGDTNTTLAGALAASKLHIPVAHVEAGLRSFNRRMPEEINRILTDHVADFLFCPTDTGVNHLKNEGFDNIVRCNEPLPAAPFPLPLAINVGDVMFDIALKLKQGVDHEEVLKRRGLEKDHFILVTIHRAENTDNKENLVNILQALNTFASRGKTVFFPLHPRTRAALENYGLLNETVSNRLILADPVSYTDMIALESN
ncbi:MAG: UDP-N-acetylglucosamine 2-epimerase (non-hydrolyzing), partial [bacterium]|nr:UDP-N-acetylglucosamine 2-epimerase (non-hydrolyzing) [bacterium]